MTLRRLARRQRPHRAGARACSRSPAGRSGACSPSQISLLWALTIVSSARRLRRADRHRGRRAAGPLRRRLAGDLRADRRGARRARSCWARRCGAIEQDGGGGRGRAPPAADVRAPPRDRRDAAGADRADPLRARASPAAATSSPSGWPSGALTKCTAVYDEPFWREDGLTGEAVSDAGPDRDHLRQLAAGRLARRAGRLHRRAPTRSSTPGGRSPSAGGSSSTASRACSASGRRGARRLPRAGLGRGGVERRRPGLLARHRGADGLRRGAAPPVRAGPLGGRRDRDGLVRLHGRRGPQRRARGGRGPGCGRMAAVSIDRRGRLAFAGAAAPGRDAARQGGLLARADRDLPGADRADRPAAERLPRSSGPSRPWPRPTPPTERASAAARSAPLLGVPIAIKDTARRRGRRHHARHRRASTSPAEQDSDAGRAPARGRRGDPRQDQPARARDPRLHRVEDLRHHPQPVEHRADHRAARAAAAAPRSPPGWPRSPTPPTARARSATRRRTAGCSA